MMKTLLLAASILLSIQHSLANPIEEALKMQRSSELEALSREQVKAMVEEKKQDMNDVLQEIFFEYYKEVKTSGLGLVNPGTAINKINTGRQRAGICCPILVSRRLDGGMYVITGSGTGMFGIDGYGLQYVSGTILDEALEKTGRVSPQCKYEISMSYRNSRSFPCSDLQARRIDRQVVDSMKEMLPKAMKDYQR